MNWLGRHGSYDPSWVNKLVREERQSQQQVPEKTPSTEIPMDLVPDVDDDHDDDDRDDETEHRGEDPIIVGPYVDLAKRATHLTLALNAASRASQLEGLLKDHPEPDAHPAQPLQEQSNPDGQTLAARAYACLRRQAHRSSRQGTLHELR